MRLTEQQLFDYIACPAKYDIKYNKKINIQEPVSLNSILGQVVSYFYINFINGKLCTLNSLKQKLDSLCEPHKETIPAKKAVEGWGLIYNFYNWACNNKIAVLDTDVHYTLTHKDIIVEGVLNPIVVNSKEQLEFLLVNFSSRVPEQIDMDMRLKYSLDVLAMNTASKDKVQAIKLHHIKTDRDLYSYRTEPDFDRLKSTLEGVAAGIENKIFYPRESILCQTCTAKQYCRFWTK